MQKPAFVGRTCSGPDRRSLLRLGSLALAGTGLTRLPGRAGTVATSEEPSVIFVWLPGGPAHIDTFDMKPDAPAEYRGAFKPIRTTVPGIEVCELLPQHAARAHRFSLIRSISHKFADHGGGHKKFMTGRDPREPTGFVNDHPAMGSMVYKEIGDTTPGVPGYTLLTDGGRQQIDTFSLGSSYLGMATHPFVAYGDPSRQDFKVPNLGTRVVKPATLAERLDLLGGIGGDPATLARLNGPEVFRDRAMELLNSTRARDAFDLTRETEKTRARYGWHAYGQRALLARRLVEAGARFVTLTMESPNVLGREWPKDVTYNWDSHAVNCHIFDDSRWRFPLLDQAVSALIDDLYDRGLDRRVLLVVTGEFGRTPKLEQVNGRPGRDHWPQAMSVLVSGGGLKMGQVVGSTTSRGEVPKDRPLVPNDLWATLLRHLKVDYADKAYLDHTGRPMPLLPDGKPISELI
jgi:hypothetical protein